MKLFSFYGGALFLAAIVTLTEPMTCGKKHETSEARRRRWYSEYNQNFTGCERNNEADYKAALKSFFKPDRDLTTEAAIMRLKDYCAQISSTKGDVYYSIDKNHGNAAGIQPGQYLNWVCTAYSIDGRILALPFCNSTSTSFKVGADEFPTYLERPIIEYCAVGNKGTIYYPPRYMRETKDTRLPKTGLYLKFEIRNVMNEEYAKAFESFKIVPRRDLAIEEWLGKRGVGNTRGSADGFYYDIKQQGKGTRVSEGQYVKVHYTGTLLDGTKFDSSKDRNAPFVFQVGKGSVIKGWDKALPLFNEGGIGRIYLPAELAYGAQATGNIPANSPLIFDIEVISVMNEQEFSMYEKVEQEHKIKEMQKQNDAQNKTDDKILTSYFNTNKLKPTKTASGLYYLIEKAGEGAKPTTGQTVSVHYTGRLLDGTKFDSSVDRNAPFEFQCGAHRVILGWDEGIALFSKGTKAKLFIPSSLAYGTRGYGPIPPNSPLIFDIELLEIK